MISCTNAVPVDRSLIAIGGNQSFLCLSSGDKGWAFPVLPVVRVVGIRRLMIASKSSFAEKRQSIEMDANGLVFRDMPGFVSS